MKNELALAFGGCSNGQRCTCTVKSSFEPVSDTRFYIMDDADTTVPVRIAAPGDNWQLAVSNPSGEELCLVKLDNCLVTAHTTQKCDCILYSSSKCYLVEIKTATTKTRKDRRREAVQQLGATIGLLRSNRIEPAAYHANAVICFKNNRPVIVNAASSSARANFLQQYGIALEEKNTLEF